MTISPRRAPAVTVATLLVLTASPAHAACHAERRSPMPLPGAGAPHRTAGINASECQGQDGVRRRHPTLCTHWISCTQGHASVVPCPITPRQLHYTPDKNPHNDPAKGHCDPPEIADCPYA
ncbi:carbohydrate-binding module family 14 protein [Spongiactinospora sp. 9N601]|uniref:carbohydrate-binding module family 14 protein n=1 Tax=Spongiactinospora sp. 9N601 TaxID=3375149 RepID=UPI0037B576B5